jgi:hypothetical protein
MHVTRSVRALAASALVLLLPTVAQAQFGGIKGVIGKKAGEKLIEKLGEKKDTTTASTAAGGGRRGDAAGRAEATGGAAANAGIEGELTADTLDRVLAALETQLARRAERDSLARLGEAANAELARLTSANAAATDAYRAREAATHECQRSFVHRLDEARGAEIQRRMKADPTFAQKAAASMQAEMMRANQAMQRGDSAAATNMYSIMYKAVLGREVDLAKDSVDMVKRCGAMPPAPAHLARQDSLHERLRDLGDRTRQAELDAQAVALERSGMSSARFGRARERVERWWVVSARGGPKFWTEREGALLAARRERIGRLMAALGVEA